MTDTEIAWHLQARLDSLVKYAATYTDSEPLEVRLLVTRADQDVIEHLKRSRDHE